MFAELARLTPIEWLVVTIATTICLVGALLPRIGNLLGRLFMGEDPLLARWQALRAAKKQAAIALRQQKRDAAKLRKKLKAQGNA